MGFRIRSFFAVLCLISPRPALSQPPSSPRKAVSCLRLCLNACDRLLLGIVTMLTANVRPPGVPLQTPTIVAILLI
jgi:hypothetical protein